MLKVKVIAVPVDDAERQLEWNLNRIEEGLNAEVISVFDPGIAYGTKSQCHYMVVYRVKTPEGGADA